MLERGQICRLRESDSRNSKERGPVGLIAATSVFFLSFGIPVGIYSHIGLNYFLIFKNTQRMGDFRDKIGNYC